MLIDNSKLNNVGPDFSAFITNNTHKTHVIITNHKIYHSHVIEAGPATVSDHLPITVTYAHTQAIKVPISIK